MVGAQGSSLSVGEGVLRLLLDLQLVFKTVNQHTLQCNYCTAWLSAASLDS